MPLIDIDPTLVEDGRYLRRYGRDLAHIVGRTVPPEARAKSDWHSKTTTSAAEKFLAASFAETDLDLGHINFLEYLCQIYATHGVYVITPDILWHTVLCEIAAEVRKTPDCYASLFTTTPGERQEIIVLTGSVEVLPLPALVEALRGRVPTDADWYLPSFSTTDPFALWARYAAFADICSPYYSYGTMLCGYRGVDVRGTAEDYERIIEHVAHLALDFAIGGGSKISLWLSGRVLPLMNRFVKAMREGDGAFFGDILSSRSCGSGGEIKVSGWWTRDMYLDPIEDAKPENAPSHLARVTWKNLETERQFSINFGLFYSQRDGGAMVPQWGYVQNEIVEPETTSAPNDGKPTFGIETVKVEAKSRVIATKWQGEIE